MKNVLLAFSIFTLMIGLNGCEKNEVEEPLSKEMGTVTVAGTFRVAGNHAVKGDIALPGIEAVLCADRIYYLSGDIRVKIVDAEDKYPDGYYSPYNFMLDNMILTERDSVQVSGMLYELIDNSDNKFYKINVKDYQILTFSDSINSL